jgi:hypothetical protein
VTRDVLIDTGSSNTWIGGNIDYHGTNCNGTFRVEYGSGYVSGKEVRSSSEIFVREYG